MSWIDKIKSRYKITTGEGSEFYVLWKNASKAYEYNISQFEFIGMPGTLVDRREPKGRTFPLEIYFDGENHLDIAAKFEAASYDKRPWNIEHPLYNNLLVQPASLNFDNSESVNYTKITGTLIETIINKGPEIIKNPIDTIEELHVQTLAASAESFATIATPVPSDMALNVDTIYNLGEPKISLQSEFEEYFNSFNEAQTNILTATANPLAAIRSVQTVIEAPARFQIDLNTRINLIKDQCNTLINSMNTIINGGTISVSKKALFENNVLSLISTMALSSGLPLPSNYKTSNEVLNVINTIIGVYNNYINIIGQLQFGTGANPDDYNPDVDSQTALNKIVNFTTSNLFNIALNAKQERTYTLEDDDNVITLSHRFYGPSVNDDKLLNFINENNIGLSEYLGLKKGRVIKYYI